ncbi:hypothetical protein GGS23DRAFT_612263 [Durotheca rogersii]|uniref:uncharacterized protein n=1 Tax=Durotheca rogersii TaxID=419775 RepID=UPI0022212850|nr:uncharacterized protein GGS23DRAFT_612263 [Durotheca rogersii]KAI5867157.1 hypothetical protein GGS23DRAFT_612263 [Durotheca rogersii]
MAKRRNHASNRPKKKANPAHRQPAVRFDDNDDYDYENSDGDHPMLDADGPPNGQGQRRQSYGGRGAKKRALAPRPATETPQAPHAAGRHSRSRRRRGGGEGWDVDGGAWGVDARRCRSHSPCGRGRAHDDDGGGGPCAECRSVRRANLRLRDWAAGALRRCGERLGAWAEAAGVGATAPDEMDWQPEPVVRVVLLPPRARATAEDPAPRPPSPPSPRVAALVPGPWAWPPYASTPSAPTPASGFAAAAGAGSAGVPPLPVPVPM